MDIEALADEIYATAKEKGFWEERGESLEFPFVAYKLTMIHSEVTEIMEAIRKDQGDAKVLDEFADVVIRLLDLYAGLRDAGEIATPTTLTEAINLKMAINRERARKHGVRG